MERKYYEAYEDRYKKIHQEKGLPWAGDRPSVLLKTLLEKYGADENSSILEVGCGEGQNALYLISEGFNIEASDISNEAIVWCKNWAREREIDEKHFFVMDALKNNLKKKYDFIYSVAVLHMLTEDDDRINFLKFIREHLKENGKAFIVVMGDGKMTRHTDSSKAFELSERPFGDEMVKVASTSCRMVTWEEYLSELDKAGLDVIKHYLDQTISGFDSSMVAEVKIKEGGNNGK